VLQSRSGGNHTDYEYQKRFNEQLAKDMEENKKKREQERLEQERRMNEFYESK